TISLVKEVEYDSAFMFIYSPRPGTGAPNLPDHVPEEVKRERIHRLIEVQNEISARKNAAMVGSVQEVLVEGKNEKEPGMLNGRTRGNKIVTFPGGEELVGRIVPGRITRSRTWTSAGEAEVPAVAGTAYTTATPMMAQYFSVKEQSPDAIVFFRLGDFYEMFGEDAETASRVLDIVLTSREAGSL